MKKEAPFNLRMELLNLQTKHDHAARGADMAFHEAVLLDGLSIAGMPFHPLYRACLERSGTEVASWKRVRRAQRAYQLARYAEMTAALPGHRVECGVLRGMSAFLLASTLRAIDPHFDGTGLYLLDSFEGLSRMHPADAIAENRYSAQPGHFNATSLDHVRAVMSDFPGCEVLKGWIPGVLKALPECDWALVHLDLDLYEPTLAALEYFAPRLVGGAVVVNDDYASPLFPGAGQAWDEYFGGRKLPYLVLDSGQAVFVNRT